jgi:hypothetical protein
LYSIRPERQLLERLKFDLLFRWFVGPGIDEAAFDASTFSKNRGRLPATRIAQEFLGALLAPPRVKRRPGAGHFQAKRIPDHVKKMR